MITKTDWQGIEAYSLENEHIRCVILPTPGAKITSLLDKKSGREWLVRAMRPIRTESAYGKVFTDNCMAGWDEMLPTIDSCVWEGKELPDHGELWGISWNTELTEECLTLTASCRALPLTLSRSVCFASENTLCLDYHLVNTGTQEVPWLWAAHPQFAATPDTRIDLPEPVTEVVNTASDRPDMGTAGSLHPWPGKNLNRIGDASLHSCQKLYIPPEIHIASAALWDEALSCGLRMFWNAEKLPYCGVWVDEGTCHELPVAAIEPSNAYYDSPVIAAENRRLSFLSAGASADWSIRVQLTGNC